MRRPISFVRAFAVARRRRRLVKRSLSILPSPQREVFTLVVARGLSYRAAAEQLDLSVDDVEDALAGALARLAEVVHLP